MLLSDSCSVEMSCYNSLILGATLCLISSMWYAFIKEAILTYGTSLVEFLEHSNAVGRKMLSSLCHMNLLQL